MVNLFKPTSDTLGAALAVGATLVWKLVSFANALLIALYFGAGSTTDVYFYVMMVMGFGVTFLQRMNAAVIIPEAMAREAARPGEERGLLNRFLYFYLLLAVCLVLAGALAPVTLARCFSRFETARLMTDKTLITLSFLLFGLQLLTAYLTAVLEMYRRFAAALLTPLNALLPLCFLGCFGRSWGIISMVYGFLAANAVQILVYGYMMRRELQWSFRPAPAAWHKQLTKNLVSNQLIELANIVSSVLPVYLLSGLAAGFVSALNYAKQLSDSPTEIFTLRVANISKIQLTESAARRNETKFNDDFLSTQHFMLFLLTPLAVFSGCFAPEIVTLFFKRGQFTWTDVQNAAAFLRPLLGIMWFMALVQMQNNVVAAGRKVKESLPYALACVGLFIVLVPFTMHAWGAFAFPYTQLGCCVVSLGINYRLFKKHFPSVPYVRSLLAAGRLALVNLAALVPPIALYYGCGVNRWPAFWCLLVCGVVFLAGLFGGTYFSGDWQAFSRQFARRKQLFNAVKSA